MSGAIYMINNSSIREKYPGQMNSFIIKTETGELIVMDGGYRGEYQHLLSMLKVISRENKPRVAGWFLSHAHRDHIDCFMEMIEKYPKDIEITHVYCKFPSVQSVEMYESYEASTIREFYHLLPRFKDILVITEEGDRYEIGGAVFEILYAPNQVWSNNMINNSCIVIRMTLSGHSVIFLGDISLEVGRQLLEKYGAELKSDYCQMAHHGQQGVEKNVYEAIAPSTCMWCTPEWLWNNDTGDGYNTSNYKTLETRKWMDELRVKKHYVMKDGDQMIPI